MIYCVYTFYNKKVNAFERPAIVQDEPNEFVERVHRDYLASDDQAKARILEFKVFHVGTFDDTTGKINLIEPNVIIDCGAFEKPLKKEGEPDVGC